MVPFLSWSSMENYKYIFNFAFLLEYTRHEIFFYLYVLSSWRASVILRFTPSAVPEMWRDPRGPPTTWPPTVCYEVDQPISLAALPLPSAVCCHFSLLLICSLVNTQLLRSRSKNVSLSVPASSKVQLCP